MATNESTTITRRNAFKGAAAVGAVAAGLGVFTPKDAEAQVQNYDAVVIGTGFGGTIATIALSKLGKSVLVLERGTFWVTPETLGAPPNPGNPLAEWAKTNNSGVQYWSRPDHALGLLDLLNNRYREDNPFGLHNYSIFDDVHILTASGVGGGSLIYSNVNLEAHPAVLDRLGLKGIDYQRARNYMEKYRGKLSKVVTKNPLPPGVDPEKLGTKFTPDPDNLGNKGYLLLDRSRALREAAGLVSNQRGIPMPWHALDLSITEYVHGSSPESDKTHTFCERQGRCLLGCLPQARHTLNKTLFNSVFKPPNTTGVALSSESEVRTIRRVGDGYEIFYIDRRGRNFKGVPRTLRTKQIFLAAGVLGTVEILLRSQRDAGLTLSEKIGTGFSTNGDFGALAVGTKMIKDGKVVNLPDGTPAKASVYPTRGPINTCDVRFEIDGRQYTIEDAGIPSMFARVVEVALKDRERLRALRDPPSFVGEQTTTNIQSLIGSIRDRIKQIFGKAPPDASKERHSTEAELIDDVFFFNAMSEDEANGTFTLDGDELDLKWPPGKPPGNQACFAKLEEVMQQLSAAMGAKYTPLPTWEGFPGVFDKRTLVVTHPLGGCRIGPTMAEGAVNEFGQLYDGSKKATDPTAVHPGFFVIDGSTMPGALAANPSLTIAAQAIKSVEHAVGTVPF